MKKWLCLLGGLFLFGSMLASAQVPAQPLDPQQTIPKTPPLPPPVSAPVLPPRTVTNQPPADTGPQLSIAAESSLRQVIQELAQSWADSRNDAPQINLKLTNSATLRSWAEKKEAYDLYLDASVEDVQALTASGALESGGQQLLARNELAAYGRIPVTKSDELDWYDLIGSQWQKVALADPQLSASGRTAAQALQKHDLWTETKGLYVFAPTDKQAVGLLQQDQADGVIGYRTELLGLQVPGFQLFEIKAEDTLPIFYTGAVSHGAKSSELALDFMKFCLSETSREVWRKDGFDPY